MNKKFFKMTLKDGNYHIEHLIKLKNLERSKVPTEVKLISSNTWVCTSKQRLIEFAETHKELRIKKLKDRLLILQSGEVIYNG